MGVHHLTTGDDGHKDYISRYMLEQLKSEGIVYQEEKSKKWFLAEQLSG